MNRSPANGAMVRGKTARAAARTASRLSERQWTKAKVPTPAALAILAACNAPLWPLGFRGSGSVAPAADSWTSRVDPGNVVNHGQVVRCVPCDSYRAPRRGGGEAVAQAGDRMDGLVASHLEFRAPYRVSVRQSGHLGDLLGVGELFDSQEMARSLHY
jgi:hypothetical protein